MSNTAPPGLVVAEIPTAPQPQTFQISLSGTFYQLTIHWCDPAQCWVMDIADQNLNAILNGVPLVTGHDLLEQFAYLEIGPPGSFMEVQSDFDIDAVPTFASLGSTGHLYYVTPAPPA